MCVRSICERCETYLDGLDNLKLCNFYDLREHPVEGLNCPDLSFSKKNSRLCHGCAMDNNYRVGNLDFLASPASEGNTISEQSPYIAHQQQCYRTYEHPLRLADEAGSLSIDMAGPSRVIQVCAPGDRSTTRSDDGGNSPQDTYTWSGVKHCLPCHHFGMN